MTVLTGIYRGIRIDFQTGVYATHSVEHGQGASAAGEKLRR